MEKIKIDDFTRFKFLSGVKHSPKGSNACFALHSADVEGNKYLSNLWIYNYDKDNYFQLTSMDKEGSFIWLKDGENILFQGLRDDKDKKSAEDGEEFSKFYRINISGGEAKEFFKINRKVNNIKQVDEDTYIFSSTYNKNKKELDSLSEDEKAKELKQRKEDKDYEVLEEIPFWSNGEGFTNRNRNRLYIYDRVTGKDEPLTDDNTYVESYNLSEDGSKVVFTAMSFEGKMELYNSVFIIDLKSKAIEKISNEDCYSYSYVNFIDNDNIISLASDMKAFGVNENHKFYIININTKERKCITPDLDFSIGDSVGSDCRYGGGSSLIKDGENIYFIATENDSSLLYKVDREGRIEKVISGKGSIDSFSAKDGNILFIGLRGLKLQELYKFNGQEVQLTNYNSWVLEERSISQPEHISVETAPGVIIDGWILKPVDFDGNKKYPAILDIHGGPKTVYGETFFHEMQYWANEGYAVFFCNPRGSDGKGNEFADIRGKYGTIDYDDIMLFTDEILQKYDFIDKERLGVTGGSYGGYMTNWIIGHTDRFKAAASQRSISNWVSKFNTTDIGYYFVEDQIAATPWGNEEKLWWHSPLKYADKVKTPTLFLHSEEDYRCWLAEGIQMFTALKFHGVESRLCMFRGENHELSRSGKPKHRIRRLTEITEWFNKHLK